MKIDRDREDERDKFARSLANSGISNEEFHKALAAFDRETDDNRPLQELED